MSLKSTLMTCFSVRIVKLKNRKVTNISNDPVIQNDTVVVAFDESVGDTYFISDIKCSTQHFIFWSGWTLVDGLLNPGDILWCSDCYRRPKW